LGFGKGWEKGCRGRHFFGLYPSWSPLWCICIAQSPVLVLNRTNVATRSMPHSPQHFSTVSLPLSALSLSLSLSQHTHTHFSKYPPSSPCTVQSYTQHPRRPRGRSSSGAPDLDPLLPMPIDRGTHPDAHRRRLRAGARVPLLCRPVRQRRYRREPGLHREGKSCCQQHALHLHIRELVAGGRSVLKGGGEKTGEEEEEEGGGGPTILCC
jgi:hypothetical protein